MIADEALGSENTLGFNPTDVNAAEDSVEELANFNTAAGGEQPLEEKPAYDSEATSYTSIPFSKKGRTVVSLPVPQDKVRTVMAHALRASEAGNKARHSYARPTVVHAVAATPVRVNAVAKVEKPRKTRNPAPAKAATTPEPKPVLKPKASKFDKKPVPVKKFRTIAKKPEQRPAIKKASTTLTSKLPQAGIYFVIGSFRNHGNARSFGGEYAGLAPTVLAAKLDGGPIYRVVVGPVAAGKERKIHRSIYRAGIADVWAIRVDPNDWFLAGPEPIRSAGVKATPEIAKLPR